MPRTHSLVGALLVTLTLAPTAGAQSSCRPADVDATGANLAWLRDFAGSTSSGYTTLRATAGMPASDSGAIEPVVVDSVCARFSQVMDSVLSTPNVYRRVRLYRFANGWYAAEDPTLAETNGVVSMFIMDTLLGLRNWFALGAGTHTIVR